MPNFKPSNFGNSLTHCPFPKHKGEKWEDVICEDEDYIHWLLDIDNDLDLSNEMVEMLETLIEEYEDSLL